MYTSVSIAHNTYSPDGFCIYPEYKHTNVRNYMWCCSIKSVSPRSLYKAISRENDAATDVNHMVAQIVYNSYAIS